MFFTQAFVLLGAFLGLSWADKVLVAQLVDTVVPIDIVDGGNCYGGCTREVHAAAHVSGSSTTPGCTLLTTTPFTSNDPGDGTLEVTVYCKDGTGALLAQGRDVCQFEVCVDFAWRSVENALEVGLGQILYDVVITRSTQPRGAHSVHVDLSIDVDPTATDAVQTNCPSNETCPVKTCSPDYALDIQLVDEYGDGWAGGSNGRYNSWTLSRVLADGSDIISEGTLPEDHASQTIKECLEDGSYVFSTTANAEWSYDMGWTVCNHIGKAGESVSFTVSNGVCEVTDATPLIVVAEAVDASESYCTLPAELTCTSLSDGLNLEGVGLYHDGRCGETDLTGCNARTIDNCRFCFYDREAWIATFPGERMPDWEDCPCCVADNVGAVCATAGGGSGGNMETFINIAIGVSCAVAISVCIACSCGTQMVRSVKRLTKTTKNLNPEDGSAVFPDSPGGGRGAQFNSGRFSIQKLSARGRTGSSSSADNAFASNTVGGSSLALGGIGPDGRPMSIGGRPLSITGSGPFQASLEALFSDGVERSVNPGQGQAPLDAVPLPSELKERSHGSMKTSPTSTMRSTVLDERLVSKGFVLSDGSRKGSRSHLLSPETSIHGSMGGEGGSRATTDWGLAMSGEYPDLEEQREGYGGGFGGQEGGIGNDMVVPSVNNGSRGSRGSRGSSGIGSRSRNQSVDLMDMNAPSPAYQE